MTRHPSLLGGALRCVAVGAGVVAIVAAMQQAPATRPVDAVAASPNSVAVDAAAPGVGSWSVRAGGWFIRVDGAEVPVPSLVEQLATRPRASLGVKISPFDRLIVHHANAEGFDWRLIAALIFEESRFDPASRSDAGAVGLMQVRPIAAEAVGATHFEAPADNVQTGVRYLRQLDDMFRIAHGRDRLAIVLAAYNMGPGHVRDAQTLARRFGYDPNHWQDAMDLMLPLLEQPTIYHQLPNGFAQGSETVAYVHRILDRYERYKLQTTGPVPGTEVLSSEGPSANG